MSKEVLMATGNPHKAERFKHYLTTLGLSVITLADIREKVEVVEDGVTPEENALKKAKAGFEVTGKPSFGVDYWFYINGLSPEKQPGPHVRRIFVGDGGVKKEAADDEMLDYYIKIVEGLGGRTQGLWSSAIALITGTGNFYIDSFSRETILTAKRSPKITKGEPLNSIQIDSRTGKYYTDLTKDEWLMLQDKRERGYIRFFEKHLDEI